MAYASQSSWASDGLRSGATRLVIDQVMMESSYLNTKMAAYYQEVHNLENKFDRIELHHIPRRIKEVADTLAKLASGAHSDRNLH